MRINWKHGKLWDEDTLARSSTTKLCSSLNAPSSNESEDFILTLHHIHNGKQIAETSPQEVLRICREIAENLEYQISKEALTEVVITSGPATANIIITPEDDRSNVDIIVTFNSSDPAIRFHAQKFADTLSTEMINRFPRIRNNSKSVSL